MRNFLLFIVALGVFFGCSSSDYKLKGRNEGGKVVIAPVDAGGTEKIMIEYNPNTNEVSIPAGNKLKVDVIEANSGGQPEGGVPAGTIVAFGGSSVPDGWFLCDGSEKSESTYAALFSAISTAWNTATNPTTGAAWAAPSGGNFRLPDLRGSFLRGVGTPHVGDAQTLAGFQNDSTNKNTLALTGSVTNYSGSKTSGNNSTDHSHSFSHTHSFAYRTPAGLSFSGNDARYMLISTSTSGVGVATPNQGASGSTTGGVSSNHTHSTNITHGHGDSFAISNGDTETRPLNVGVNYIIKY